MTYFNSTLYPRLTDIPAYVMNFALYWLGKGAGLNEMLQVNSTVVTFGKPWDFPSYGWDNEYGQASRR